MEPESTAPGPSLIARTAHGFAWVFAWRMATRVLGLFSTLILVRLLAPAEFGLVAIAMSFTQSIDLFSQIGVEEALIRLPHPTARTYDTAFTMVAIRCLTVAAIAAGASVPAAYFFAEPRLVPILMVTSAVTAISGLENIGVQDFRRHMRFDQEFMLQALPRLAGLVTTITLAFLLRNYWALVLGTAAMRVTRVIMSYRVHPLRPHFSLTAWRDLIGYSLWTWAICVARVIRDQPTTFIVGHVLGPAKLGILSVGSEIASLTVTEIVMPMGRSLFSAFAWARRTGEDMEAIFRRLSGATLLFTLPANVGLALVAPPLVRVMLGPAWDEVVFPLQMVAIAGGFAILGHACHAQFDALAMLRQDLVAIVLNAMVKLALLLGFVPPMGLRGAAFALALAMLAEPVIYLAIKARFLPLSLGGLASVLVRPLLGSIAMAATVQWSGTAVSPTANESTADLSMRLAEAVSLGAVTYGAVVFALWITCGRPPSAEAEILAVLKEKSRRARFWLAAG